MKDPCFFDNWSEYWECYERLCHDLELEEKTIIAKDLKDIQEEVNGMTDGWYQFIESISEIELIHEASFSERELAQLKCLKEFVKNKLDGR